MFICDPFFKEIQPLENFVSKSGWSYWQLGGHNASVSIGHFPGNNQQKVSHRKEASLQRDSLLKIKGLGVSQVPAALAFSFVWWVTLQPAGVPRERYGGRPFLDKEAVVLVFQHVQGHSGPLGYYWYSEYCFSLSSQSDMRCCVTDPVLDMKQIRSHCDGEAGRQRSGQNSLYAQLQRCFHV